MTTFYRFIASLHNMKVNIHRGTNQIGGNIIEIASKTTKILLDAGLDLDSEKNKDLPPIAGLFTGKGFDAVFISHYHGDHLGLAYQMSPQIPLYLGERASQIVAASDEYKNNQPLHPAGLLKHQTPIQIGDMTITPYLCDHSAYDSYMLLVDGEGERILYTGDFRSNGRKPFGWLLSQLPTKVDTLICEGTTLSRDDKPCETEATLEEGCVQLFSKTKGPIFVLQSSMNIDRIVTMFRAAKRCERVFLQELYMACITSAVKRRIPNPNEFREVKTFITKGYHSEHHRYRLFNQFGKNKIGRAQIAKTKFVMCVRTPMIDYLKKLNQEISFEGGLLVYSLWGGYKKQNEMANFIKACEAWGLTVIDIHTSGHADAQTIKALITHTNPSVIIPVHTENSQWFSKNFGDRIIR